MLRATIEPEATAVAVVQPKKFFELRYVDVGIAAVISGFAFSLGAGLFSLLNKQLKKH